MARIFLIYWTSSLELNDDVDEYEEVEKLHFRMCVNAETAETGAG